MPRNKSSLVACALLERAVPMQEKALPGSYLIRLALPAGFLCLAAALFLSTRSLEARSRTQSGLAAGPIVRFNSRATLPSDCTARLDEVRVPVEYSLRRGETLSVVLRRLGMTAGETHQVTSDLAQHISLLAIRAGDRYSALFNPDASLASVDLSVEGEGRVEMSRASATSAGAIGEQEVVPWRVTWQPVQRGRELRALQGTLDGESSLEAAIHRAGGPPGLAYRMADALQWDLDFARDLRRGDHFEVLYEAVQLDGKDHGVGELLALVYENQGRRHEAYRFGDGETLYDSLGQPLRKMFLRSPLRYTHITSPFSQHRLHPVLGEFRPHYGVDYSAPVGTPVEVTANGIVLSAGWDGGGGNVVRVQHGSDFVTAYLHLSRFAAGIRPGVHVRQGDVIAYTGATGLATGPHLDYRVKYRGDWVDPLSLKGVRDEPLSQIQLASFLTWRDSVRSSMANGVIAAGLTLPAHRPAEMTRLARLNQPGGRTGGRAAARAALAR
jgi:murein DD-endopeptidase MepM/ murein hydrolase activator NlpD